MRRLLGTLALAACAVIGTSAPALAQTPVCDAYSDACVGGTKTVRPNRPSGDPGALPFTGGQVLGMLVVGGGAVAAGTVFVAAGRKRRTAS